MLSTQWDGLSDRTTTATVSVLTSSDTARSARRRGAFGKQGSRVLYCERTHNGVNPKVDTPVSWGRERRLVAAAQPALASAP